MTNGVISLDDIQSSGNDGGSTDSDNDGSSELREACERIGADADNAVARVESDSGIEADDLIDLAESLADNDELWDVQEQYREMSGQNRINANFLRGHDKEFTDWSAAFYGDSSTDEEGTETYNQMQNLSRNMDGNLYYYKALFPEPHMEHWPSDSAVCWMERPDEDADIYVTEEFVEEYGDFTVEIDGQDRPVPPWNGASASGGSSNDDAIDPRDYTNAEIEEVVGDLTRDQLESLLEVEKATKSRKGAKNAIRDEIDARDASSDDDEDSDSVSLDDLSDDAKAALKAELLDDA